jgi:flagellar FliL protein
MAEGEEAEVPKKKKRTLVWIIAGVAFLVAAGVGGLLLRDYLRPPQVVASDDTGGAAKKDKEGIESKVKSTMNLDPFIVNLADTDATRFVKLTLRLGLDESGLGEELDRNPVVVAAARDKIISILTTKTSDQILTPEGKDKLRAEVRDAVNPVLPRGKIVEVFIMDFVVQL